ncbi:MAG TPA: nitroreductase family protein [Stellaceae bacterium]
MHRILTDEALDSLFRTACSPNAWLDRPISDTLLRAVWELARLGPASPTALSVRALFLRSPQAKERLASALSPNARAAALAAPVAAILAAEAGDLEGAPVGVEARAQAVAGGSLRGAYLILAARALGFDCHPIWDFDASALERVFFPDSAAVASFVCGLGCGDEAQRAANPPQPVPDEACRFL